MSNQEYWNNVGKGLENAFNPNNWSLGRFGGGGPVTNQAN